IISFVVVLLVENTLRPILREVSKVKVAGLATKMINKAVYEKSNQLKYGDLVTTKTDQQGNIILMQPNLHKINKISSQLTLEIQKYLKQIDNNKVQLPIMQVFGIQVLAKYGPQLDAKIVPYNSVETDIVDYFQSAGINQTRHKIDLEVTAKVKVVVPFMSDTIRVQTTVPLSEAVIVGRVPKVYVGLEKGLISTKEN
ncbi:MAG: sporulation protein YunB, partial [Candidatus Frackibacter sp. T328-2]